MPQRLHLRLERDLNRHLEHVREQDAAEREEKRVEEENREKEVEVLAQERKQLVSRNLRPATPAEYRYWLKGYLMAGGGITHVYDYPTPSERNFYMALNSFDMIELHGALALRIIVPQFITVEFPTYDQVGHSTLYHIRRYNHRHNSVCGMHFVPLYSDVRF